MHSTAKRGVVAQYLSCYPSYNTCTCDFLYVCVTHILVRFWDIQAMANTTLHYKTLIKGVSYSSRASVKAPRVHSLSDAASAHCALSSAPSSSTSEGSSAGSRRSTVCAGVNRRVVQRQRELQSLSVAGNRQVALQAVAAPERASASMKTVQVNLGDRSYPIYIGAGLLNQGELLRKHIPGKRVLIVTNETIAPLYLDR